MEHTLNTILKSKKLFQHSQFLIENAKEHLLKSVDYVSYGMTDTLDLGELDISQCENLFITHGVAKDALVDVVKEFWEVITFFFIAVMMSFRFLRFTFILMIMIRQATKCLMKKLWLSAMI